MRRFFIFLGIHVALLFLASTRYTPVTCFWGENLQWEYFKYQSESGWGHPYEFTYSLPLVLTYIAAYAIGLIVYTRTYRDGDLILGVTGALLNLVGLASFTFELTHWFRDHNNSWIFSAPIVAFALSIIAAFMRYRQYREVSVIPAQV